MLQNLGREPRGHDTCGYRHAALLLAVAALALSSCGLDIIPYLDPPMPSAEGTPSTPLFAIINQPTAVVEFRGFEVDYKFYSSDQTMETSLDTLEKLVAAKFSRMCSPGKLSTQVLPLVYVDPVDRNRPVPPNPYVTTVLDFNLVLTPYGDYLGTIPRLIDVCRSAVDALSDTKTFALVDLDQADTDLTGVNWTQVSTDHQLFLVVYALSYGLKDITVPLYSTARYLGYMSYTIP